METSQELKVKNASSVVLVLEEVGRDVNVIKRWSVELAVVGVQYCRWGWDLRQLLLLQPTLCLLDVDFVFPVPGDLICPFPSLSLDDTSQSRSPLFLPLVSILQNRLHFVTKILPWYDENA